MTEIILKQGTGVPSDTDVEVAEVALDTSSGAMYTKLADGSVKHLNPDNSGGGESLWEQNGDDIYYSDGSVGIGVDSPEQKLHIKTANTEILRVENTASSLSRSVFKGSGGTPQVDIAFSQGTSTTGYIGIERDTGDVFIDTRSTDGKIKLQYFGSDKVVMDKDGNVGIGTTNPIAKTQIAKTDGTALLITSEATNANTQSGCIDFQGSSSGVGQGARISAPSEATYGRTGLAFFTSNDASDTFSPQERMRIDADGNVGVGIISPTEKLHVADGTFKVSGSSTPDRGFSLYTTIGNGRTDNAVVYNASDATTGEHIWTAGGTERMRINPDGKVGIGGEPGTRTIDEAKALAKTKLNEWKAEVKKRTAEQPEASTQEITLEVTDGDFGVMPTEEALAEFLQGRAIGGGDAKLQVAGDGYFDDNVLVNRDLQVRYGHLNLSRYCAWQSVPDITDSIRFGASNENIVSKGRAYGYEAYTTGEDVYTNLRWCIGVKRRDEHNPDVFKDVEEVFNIDSDGNVNAKGDVVAYSSSVSDARLKDNVETIDNALDKVCALRGVSYTWNQGSREGQQDIGVIAQEVETVFPEIVREHEMTMLDGETYKTVDYEKLCGALIEAVKELKAEVEALKRG